MAKDNLDNDIIYNPTNSPSLSAVASKGIFKLKGKRCDLNSITFVIAN
jgi:hypothetical protein